MLPVPRGPPTSYGPLSPPLRPPRDVGATCTAAAAEPIIEAAPAAEPSVPAVPARQRRRLPQPIIEAAPAAEPSVPAEPARQRRRLTQPSVPVAGTVPEDLRLRLAALCEGLPPREERHRLRTEQRQARSIQRFQQLVAAIPGWQPASVRESSPLARARARVRMEPGPAGPHPGAPAVALPAHVLRPARVTQPVGTRVTVARVRRPIILLRGTLL
jgi:hypothetical protein